jgi:hypothetical protein
MCLDRCIRAVLVMLELHRPTMCAAKLRVASPACRYRGRSCVSVRPSPDVAAGEKPGCFHFLDGVRICVHTIQHIHLHTLNDMVWVHKLLTCAHSTIHEGSERQQQQP